MMIDATMIRFTPLKANILYCHRSAIFKHEIVSTLLATSMMIIEVALNASSGAAYFILLANLENKRRFHLPLSIIKHHFSSIV